MKRNFESLVALVVALLCGSAMAQADVLTVNDGVATSNFVPINSPDYSEAGTRSQFIYPAEELTAMQGLPIDRIIFYINDEANKMDGGLLRISVGETEQTTYASSSAYLSGLTPVAQVTMTRGENDIVIDFDTPYTYNGGNLVIDTYVVEPGEFGWTYFLGEVQANSTAISRDDLRQFLPKATFHYGEAPEYGAMVKHDQETFSTIRVGERDQLMVTLRNTGLNAFTPSVSTTVPFSASLSPVALEPGASVEIPVTFEPTAAGTYHGVLSIDCGQAGIVEVALSGVALEGGKEYTVCDGTAENQYVPFNGLYADDVNTFGQMIYPAEKLAEMKDGKIVGMVFYTKAPINMKDVTLQLSLMNTDQQAFDQPVAITGLSTVATADVVNLDRVISFDFDQPFEYTGGNLAVMVQVVTKGRTATTIFLGEKTEDYASMSFYKSWSGDKAETYQFLPKATFTYQEASAPEALRGDVNGDENVNISDVTALIDILLTGNEAPAAADCNQDGDVNISDVTALIDYLLSNHWSE